MSGATPNEFMQLLGALTNRHVRYVVCGGVACIMHGVERTTAALDLVVELARENLRGLIEVAKLHSLQPRVPEPMEAMLDEDRRKDWIENKNAKVFTLVSSATTLQVDVMLQYPVGFDDLWQDSRLITIENVSFRISSKRHLIAAKQLVDPPRARDRRDIEDLEELIRREQARPSA